MMTFLGFLAVTCIAIVAYIITTMTSVGVVEIFLIAIFGCAGIIAMILFSGGAIAKYTGKKVKNCFTNLSRGVKKLKK